MSISLANTNKSGAGVLIVSNGSIIAVRDVNTKEFSDCGGKIQGTSRTQTAINECFEETRTVIKLSIDDLVHYVDISAGKTGHYRCYIVHYNVSGICTAFKNAGKAAGFTHLPHAYHETDMMLRFPVNKLTKGTNGWINNVQADDHGNGHKFSTRLCRIILEAQKKNLL